MITSLKNPKVQWVRSLQSKSRSRREDQVFIVEGVRLAEEALQAGWPARLVFYTEDLSERGKAVIAEYSQRGVPVEVVDPAVMQAASDTATPQGILVVLELRDLPLPSELDFAFIPDGVRDPGNLGTMLRTAAAAGVQTVFIPPGTADPFAPKVVRAGMGAHFRLPVIQMGWKDIANVLHLHSLQLYLAAAGTGLAFHQCNFRQPVALVIGGEAEGAGQEAERQAAASVHIPMPGQAESLNAAIAAAVLLFEVVRQRSSSE